MCTFDREVYRYSSINDTYGKYTTNLKEVEKSHQKMGSEFKNSLFSEVATKLGIKHSFSPHIDPKKMGGPKLLTGLSQIAYINFL